MRPAQHHVLFVLPKLAQQEVDGRSDKQGWVLLSRGLHFACWQGYMVCYSAAPLPLLNSPARSTYGPSKEMHIMLNLHESASRMPVPKLLLVDGTPLIGRSRSALSVCRLCRHRHEAGAPSWILDAKPCLVAVNSKCRQQWMQLNQEHRHHMSAIPQSFALPENIADSSHGRLP